MIRAGRDDKTLATTGAPVHGGARIGDAASRVDVEFAPSGSDDDRFQLGARPELLNRRGEPFTDERRRCMHDYSHIGGDKPGRRNAQGGAFLCGQQGSSSDRWWHPVLEWETAPSLAKHEFAFSHINIMMSRATHRCCCDVVFSLLCCAPRRVGRMRVIDAI